MESIGEKFSLSAHESFSLSAHESYKKRQKMQNFNKINYKDLFLQSCSIAIVKNLSLLEVLDITCEQYTSHRVNTEEQKQIKMLFVSHFKPNYFQQELQNKEKHLQENLQKEKDIISPFKDASQYFQAFIAILFIKEMIICGEETDDWSIAGRGSVFFNRKLKFEKFENWLSKNLLPYMFKNFEESYIDNLKFSFKECKVGEYIITFDYNQDIKDCKFHSIPFKYQLISSFFPSQNP